jgi:hypothetical protein
MPVSTRQMSTKSVPKDKDTASSAQLKWFLISAWDSYDSSTMSLSNWARQEARRFHHDVNKEVKFAEVYDTLLEFGEGMVKDRSPSPRSPVPEKLKGDAALVNVIVADGEMTDAEQRLGRSKLHSVLHREFCRWWGAFLLEAKEDTRSGAPSASDRFSYHCARILSRKTGLRDDLIAPVVGAWLIEKATASK